MAKKGQRNIHNTLKGSFLVAMPSLRDENFSRSVVFVFAHGDRGAIGLVLNRPFVGLDIGGVMAKLAIPAAAGVDTTDKVRCGGPVSAGRGFVLHSTDRLYPSTLETDVAGVAISSGRDVLEAMGKGEGPSKSISFLGYAGWIPGQLEAEIAMGSWLCLPATGDIILGTAAEELPGRILTSFGISWTDLETMGRETANA